MDGRDIDLIRIGDGKNKVWLIGRQHPGETQPSFWMEGVLDRLTSKSDPVASALRKSCTFYVVPLMCPDGASRGHLRTNASGANLNREWDSLKDKETGKIRYEAPTLERSPEVYYVLKEMDRIGVDMAMDVHGDEELPHVFLAGGQGTKVWGPRLEMLFSALAINYSKACPDFGQLILLVTTLQRSNDFGIGRRKLIVTIQSCEFPSATCLADTHSFELSRGVVVPVPEFPSSICGHGITLLRTITQRRGSILECLDHFRFRVVSFLLSYHAEDVVEGTCKCLSV